MATPKKVTSNTTLKKTISELEKQIETLETQNKNMVESLKSLEQYLGIMLSLVDKKARPLRKNLGLFRSWKDVKTHILALIRFADAQANAIAQAKANEAADTRMDQPS